ncbi:MAG TPA: DUF3822 family protein, partial [Mucilaginibacter sp.]|nr:DUF3822 family protein [Mucilaginibacter sp.]
IIGLPFTGFTFVPLSLFNPDKIADFARFLDVKPGEKIFSQPMDEDNQVIFKVDADIASAIDGKFILRDIVFSPKGWITAAADDNPADTGLYLNITGNRVGILNFRDGKLRFFNRFEFETADELAYYAAFVTGELKQQPQDITVVVSGDVLTGDENMKRLSEFFGKVELNQLQPVALPDQAPPHTVLSLTALSLCGSSVAN